MLYSVAQSHVMACDVKQCHDMSCNVMKCHAMSCNVMYVRWLPKKKKVMLCNAYGRRQPRFSANVSK